MVIERGGVVRGRRWGVGWWVVVEKGNAV